MCCCFFVISCNNFLLRCEREAKKMLFLWDLNQSVSATRLPFKTRWVQVVNWVFWAWESPGLFPIKMKQLFRVSTRVYRQRRFKMYERTFAIPPAVSRLLANENVRNLMPDGMWYSWALLDLISCFFRAKEEENIYNFLYFFPHLLSQGFKCPTGVQLVFMQNFLFCIWPLAWGEWWAAAGITGWSNCPKVQPLILRATQGGSGNNLYSFLFSLL